MENLNKKCSFKGHKENYAIIYCQECKKYLCNKCLNYHSGLFEDHELIHLNKESKDIFNVFCKEENHQQKLEFFCKTHNRLCCLACISKIEIKNYGIHKDCSVCPLEKIKDEKRNKLLQNIKILKKLSSNIEQSIAKLMEFFEKINKDKEEIKSNIQKTFTSIRNLLNQREDDILLEVDKQYNSLYCDEDIIKESKKLPNKIKLCLDKGKKIDKELNDKNLGTFINDCINIENTIKDINLINNNINKCKAIDKEICFNTELKDTITSNIKLFWNIYFKNNLSVKKQETPKINTINKSDFKDEELKDPDCVECLNTLQVLDFKIKKYEEIRDKIDGRTPRVLMQRIIKMRCKQQSLLNSLGVEINPQDYLILLKTTYAHDQKLVEYFNQTKNYENSKLVSERLPLIIKETEELIKQMPIQIKNK